MTLKQTRRRRPRPITDRVTVDTYDAPRRHLARGDEVTLAGVPNVRGRCVFLSYTRHEDGREWLDVIEARSGKSRTVRPDAIKTVHRARRTGASR